MNNYPNGFPPQLQQQQQPQQRPPQQQQQFMRPPFPQNPQMQQQLPPQQFNPMQQQQQFMRPQFPPNPQMPFQQQLNPMQQQQQQFMRPPMPPQQQQQQFQQLQPPHMQMQQLSLSPQSAQPARQFTPRPPMPPQLTQQQPPLPQPQQQQQPFPTMMAPPSQMPQQMPHGMPQQIPQQMQQQQPKTKLNPDLVPAPVDVLADDQAKWDQKSPEAGLFRTRSDENPPLALTECLTVDEGNAGPRFMRLTTYCLPCTGELAVASGIPLGLVIQPFAELKSNEAPIEVCKSPISSSVTTGSSGGPVRCVRCRTYMNPNMIFTHGGQKFICNICNHSNDVPADYFCALDSNGYRFDWADRPELRCGVVDFEASDEFCLKPPVAARFMFVLDTSFYAVSSGALAVACQAIREMLDYFPCDDDEIADDGNENTDREVLSRCRIGIMTYDKIVHFFNLSPSLQQPQIMAMSDIDDPFVPIQHGLFVDPVQSRHVIEKLLDSIPTMFSGARTAEICFGSTIRAAQETMKATGGRMVVMCTALPSIGPGTLKPRDDPKLLNTDKERQLYVPQDSIYQKLGQECADIGIGIDLFLFPSQYMDVATVGVLGSLTGGQTYLYPGFRAEVDSLKFSNDLQRLIIRPFGYDGLMRVRVGNGLRVAEHFGNFYMKNSTDVEMAVIDSEKALGVLLKHDGVLVENKSVSIQAALLYTSATGKRFIRCMNLSVGCSNQMGAVFRKADMDTIMNILTKQAISQTISMPLKEVRQMLHDCAVKSLSSYRKNCATMNSPGQLILPESLKLFPVYTVATMKTRSFTQSNVSIDIRTYEMRSLRAMPISTTMVYFYPRVLSIHDISASECVYDPQLNRFVLPKSVRASVARLAPEGVYLLDNGLSLWLWIGQRVSPALVRDLFGAPGDNPLNIDTRMSKLPQIDTAINEKVRALISYIQDESHKGDFATLRIVRQGVDDAPFLALLVEDASEFGQGFIDYMCALHKEILTALQ